MPDGYAIVRVDSRGAGRSPGYLDVWSPREAKDIYDCVEWAGTQPWCNGKVGINGISYYAMNQWHVAPLQPPHLAALCIWEGSSDYYRELARHGGILCDFLDDWSRRQVTSVQHGVGERGPKSPVTGELVAGPETLSEAGAGGATAPTSRGDALRAPADRRLLPRPHAGLRAASTCRCSRRRTGAARGCTRAAISRAISRAGSKQKWLEVHGDTHFSHFYTELRRRPCRSASSAISSRARTPAGTSSRRSRSTSAGRARNSRCAPRTNGRSRARSGPSSICSPTTAACGSEPPQARGRRCPMRRPATASRSSTPPMTQETGDHRPGRRQAVRVVRHQRRRSVPGAAGVRSRRARRSSSSARNDPRTPIGLGWLRASHRKLDPKRTLPYRPWHTHDEEWPLTPGEPVELDVEIWPTCIVVPPGYRIGLTVRGKDYEYDGTDAALPHARLSDEGRRSVHPHRSA